MIKLCRVCNQDFSPSPSQIKECQWICKLCRSDGRRERKERMKQILVAAGLGAIYEYKPEEGKTISSIGKARKKTFGS